jgi:adenylate cyclase
MWRITLLDGHRQLIVLHRLFRHLPSSPRCKMCFSPFGGLGGRLVAPFGFRPSRKNPTLCANCYEDMPLGGAEVETAVLFADIRGSSRLAESDGPAKFAQRLAAFYADCTAILVDHDAIIDKMIGDEVMALFVPGTAGKDFRRKAVEAALALTAHFGTRGAEAGEIAVGAAVHCGPAYVGNVGSAHAADLTAIGDTVNYAAHLQAAARPGEVLISPPLQAALALPGFVPHQVVLKGRSEPAAVFSHAAL